MIESKDLKTKQTVWFLSDSGTGPVNKGIITAKTKDTVTISVHKNTVERHISNIWPTKKKARAYREALLR